MQTATGTRRLWMLFVLVVVATGCSDPPDPRQRVVPVTGRVLFKGKPVVHARVTFLAQGAPRQAVGETDSDGRFVLSTWGEDDGAALGEHVITVLLPQAATPMREVSEGDYAAAMEAQRSQQAAADGLPAHYANAKTSDLRCKVTESGPNDFDLELEDR
jgi:hypothetical protein